MDEFSELLADVSFVEQAGGRQKIKSDLSDASFRKSMDEIHDMLKAFPQPVQQMDRGEVIRAIRQKATTLMKSGALSPEDARRLEARLLRVSV